jgi:hypothetical protein
LLFECGYDYNRVPEHLEIHPLGTKLMVKDFDRIMKENNFSPTMAAMRSPKRKGGSDSGSRDHHPEEENHGMMRKKAKNKKSQVYQSPLSNRQSEMESKKVVGEIEKEIHRIQNVLEIQRKRRLVMGEGVLNEETEENSLQTPRKKG